MSEEYCELAINKFHALKTTYSYFIVFSAISILSLSCYSMSHSMIKFVKVLNIFANSYSLIKIIILFLLCSRALSILILLCQYKLTDTQTRSSWPVWVTTGTDCGCEGLMKLRKNWSSLVPLILINLWNNVPRCNTDLYLFRLNITL